MAVKNSEITVAILGGVIAEVVFELYAWLLSPMLFGLSLEPAKLVMALFKQYGGIGLSYQVAYAVHSLIGIIGFSLFVLLVKKALPFGFYVSGFIAGLALWFIAQGLLAPAIGREFMMAFGPYTQSSFVGHVGMTMIIAAFLSWRLGQK